MQKKATAAAPAKSAQKAVKSAPAKGTAAPSTAAKKSQPAKAATKTTPAKTAAASVTKAPHKEPAHKETAPKDTGGKSAATRPAKEVSKTVVAKKAESPAAKKSAAAKPKPKGDRAAFLAKQRELLLEERGEYISSAEALKAQADSLALEHEPGDVQFDEEGGEGGTANVDREIDLYLSAQARATVVEIDRALQKIDDGTYGVCEHCGQTIPDARLQALPYAALCVTCKSGGLSSRR